MRYTPIGQKTPPILLRSRRPRRDPADAYYAAEDPRGRNQCMGVQSALMAHVPQHRMRTTHSRKEVLRVRHAVFFRRTPDTPNPGKEINSINSSTLLTLPVKLNGRRMQALVDSGSQANYLSARAVFLARLRPLRKEESYPLHVANGQPMPGGNQITHKVTGVTLSI